MAEANRDEVEKCKQIALNALSSGEVDKAVRFLQKAKRMCPEDASIDSLLQQAQSGGGGGGGAAPGPSQSRASEGPSYPRQRPSAASASADRGAPSGATRTNKDGKKYTAEQAGEVQRILRTKDYYDILGIPRESEEDVVKKAYKKLALKLHPDKNSAPGADEAFKKVSRAVQCLTDEDKKKVYDRYGDEEHIPQHHRHHYQQDFMTPEDLFAAFFGGGFHPGHHHHHRQQHDEGDAGGVQRAHLFQMLPVFLLVFLTLASNFGSRDSGSRFSFTPSQTYVNERQTATLNTNYYVSNDFDDHYPEGTRSLSEFERQVEIYHVRNLRSECDYQEKVMYKKVMIAKRRGSQEELQKARNHPRPACKDIEKVKKRHPTIYRSAMYMGGF